MDWLSGALDSGVKSLQDYLSAHVLLCLVPAFFIAGAIAVFLKKEQILKYMGPKANKAVSYGFASMAGTLLAVCSCTILPLFASIRTKGAGLGPAIAFLFSGPAINILAIVYTASALGFDIGLARAVSAILLSIVIGLTMAFLFKEKVTTGPDIFKTVSGESRRGHRVSLFFMALLAVLLVATSGIGLMTKAALLIALIVGIQYALVKWFKRGDALAWFNETWGFTKKIFPLILIGVFITGIVAFFLPYEYIRYWLGGNGIMACLIAAAIGTVLYMPTLLEVPIVGSILGYKMGVIGAGPALALLLAGPGVSLQSLLVIRGILGAKKTVAYAGLVVLYSALAGFLFGSLAG